MPLPTGYHNKAPATYAGAAQTDFLYLVDLSLMKPNWWAAVDTTDFTRMRFGKGDGTELAFDPLPGITKLTSTTGKGHALVKWSGLQAASGADDILVYPAQLANSPYGVSDVYGQYNAYPSEYLAFWPLNSDANDRTRNAAHGTPDVGLVVGGVAGKIGDATDFGGLYQITVAANNAIKFTSAATIHFWAQGVLSATIWKGIVTRRLNSGAVEFEISQRGSSNDMSVRGSGVSESRGGDFTTGINHYLTRLHPTGSQLYENNVSVSANIGVFAPETGTIANVIEISDSTATNAGLHWDKTIEHLAIINGDPDGSWRQQQYDQANDNAAFWGTWTEVAAVSGGDNCGSISRPQIVRPRVSRISSTSSSIVGGGVGAGSPVGSPSGAGS